MEIGVSDTLLLAVLVVLTSLVALQQLQLLMMDEYCHYHQRQLYETQILDSACRKRRKRTRNRRFWIRPGRPSLWWDNFVTCQVLEDWKENFRMSRENFFILADLLRPHIERRDTHIHCAISVEKQVALTLYYFADEGRLRKIANYFGISRASCSITIRKVSYAITTYLGPHFIKLPLTEESVKKKVQQFYDADGIPVFGCHRRYTYRDKESFTKLYRLY